MGVKQLSSLWSLAWVDSPRLARLVHPSLLGKSTIERLRAKLLAVLGLFLTIAGPAIASGYFRNGELVYGGAFIFCTVLFLGVFLSIRLIGSTRLSSHLGSFALWTGTLLGTYALGGAASIATRWFAVIPVIAAVFGGVRIGFVWFIISWLTYVSVALAPEHGIDLHGSEVGADPIHMIVSMTTFMVIVSGLFGFSELIRVWLVRERQSNVAVLEETRRDLVAANLRLEARVEERTADLRTKNDELRLTLDSLRETQEKLVQSERLASLSRIVAGTAHELRNPLNFVNNFAELTLEYTSELEEALSGGGAWTVGKSSRRSSLSWLRTSVESMRMAVALRRLSPRCSFMDTTPMRVMLRYGSMTSFEAIRLSRSEGSRADFPGLNVTWTSRLSVTLMYS